MSQKHINEDLEQRIRELEEENSELRQGNKKYRQLIENLNEVLYTLDENAVVTYISPNVEQISGHRPDEIIGRPFTDFVHPEDLENRLENFQKVFSGQDLVTEYRYITKTGDSVWIRTHGRPFIRGGKFAGIQGILVDITERRNMEEDLRRSEREKDLILNSAAEKIIYYDTDLRIIWANRVAAELAGKSEDELIGRKCYEVWHNRSVPCPDCVVQEARDAGAPRQKEKENHDGRYWLQRAYPSLTSDGGVRAVVLFARDITKQKNSEAEKEELQKQFYQAQRLESVGRLAGGVAHDLNNLLSPILGYGEMLLSSNKLNDEENKQIASIVEAGKSARAMVRQLLAFSRQQMLEAKPFDLNKVLKRFKSLLRHAIRKDISIHLSLADSLPLIKGDAGQVEQVLMNLAVNAQDAMPHGGDLSIETADVELDHAYAGSKKGVTPGHYVMLTVSDTGIGMDAGTMENLFEPFFTTKGKDKGTGLGLSTAYGIIKQHGGNIWAYSEPGLGTTFRVYLPASPEAAKEKEPSSKRSYEKNRRGSEAVLLVEDEKVVREMVSALLKRQGYRVLAAQNGKEALSMLNDSSEPLELLLTDVIMPDMNGKELYEEILKNYPGLKAIFMSGYTENVIAYHGILESGVNFIQKPFSIEELNGKLRRVLSN